MASGWRFRARLGSHVMLKRARCFGLADPHFEARFSSTRRLSITSPRILCNSGRMRALQFTQRIQYWIYPADPLTSRQRGARAWTGSLTAATKAEAAALRRHCTR